MACECRVMACEGYDGGRVARNAVNLTMRITGEPRFFQRNTANESSSIRFQTQRRNIVVTPCKHVAWRSKRIP
jgi:hypothetical protein